MLLVVGKVEQMFLLKNNMLSKRKRVDINTFKAIWDKGSIISGSFFVFKYIKALSPRYAFVVSKKIAKTAVKRNSLRRIGYNILRESNLLNLNGIFFYKKEGLDIKKEDLKNDILKIFSRVK